MKGLFLFLLLVNLAYLGWRSWIVAPPAPPALIEAADVPRLALVGESPRSLGSAARTVAAETMAERPDNGDEPAASPAPADLGTAGDTAGVTAAAPPPQETQPTADEPAAAADGPPGEPSGTAEIETRTEVAVAAVARRCVSLGPFLNLREATEASAMLIEAGLEPSQRLAESQVWFGHWVHLPPQPTRDAAVAIVEDLRAKGISDIYIEPSGPLRNSISLGVFNEREHAETMAGRIRRLGVSPQIRDRYRDSSVYWVDFALPAGRVIDASAYQASPRRVLRIEGRDCPADG